MIGENEAPPPPGEKNAQEGQMLHVDEYYPMFGDNICVPVTPPNNNDESALHLEILGVPAEGARSRTETQIRFTLAFNTDYYKFAVLESSKFHQESTGMRPMDLIPPGSPFVIIDGTVLKSDGQNVLACLGCVMRERRKLIRKRTRLDGSDCDETLQVTDQDRERILIFAGATPAPEIKRGELLLPCRITCYCRHQDEKVGFRVNFTLRDGLTGQLLVSALSPPIMIMDDHKRRQVASPTATPVISRPLPIASVAAGVPLPSILKLIPAEGPMYGGVEVTVIGSNFSGSTIISFGMAAATTILFLNTSTMVVRLPPSIVSGFVPVICSVNPVDACSPRFQEQASACDVFFHYKNDLDRSMMELALQLIGMKMTGRVDDAREVAMRIIQESAIQQQPTDPIISGEGVDRLERTLVASLTAAEIFGGFDWSAADLARVRTSAGQTLLHLAALRRMPALFEYLASFEGCLVDATDANGFLPGDLAYLQGMDQLLLNLGMEEDWMLEEVCELKRPEEQAMTRYGKLLQAAPDRRDPPRPWKRKISKAVEWIRHPSRYRGSMGRIQTCLWRRFFPASSVKPYYFFRMTGLDVQKAGPLLKHRLEASCLRNLLGAWLGSLLQTYRHSEPFGGRRLRDLMLWYAWAPIVLAAVLLAVVRPLCSSLLI